MGDKIIKSIKFKAEFESAKEFDKWLKEQEKDLDMSLDNAFNKNVRAYQTKMKAIYKAIEEAGDAPSQAVMSSIHASIKELVPLSKQVATQFSKLKLGQGLSAELDAAIKKVKTLENQIRSKKGNQTKQSRLLTEDGSALSDKGLEKVYKQELTKKSLTVNGKTYGKDGLGAEEFIKDFKANTQAFYEAAKESKDAESFLQKAVEDKLADVKSKIRAYTDGIKAAQKELHIANQELADTKKKAKAKGRGKQVETASTGYSAAINLATNVTDTERTAGKNTGSKMGDAAEETKKFNKETKKTPGLVKKAATQVLTYGTIVGLFKRGLSEAKRTIIELDKALTDMAIVTNLSREQAWEMVDSLQAMAKETGTTTTAVASTLTKFLQQGKSMTQATQMTEAALKAASIAGIDASRSVDLLTNAMNGFQMNASQALEVSDKFAALAAASATDYEELAVALSKVAAQANLAGMSMDFTLGMLAKGIEVTREAPETIGTALKTVIARMRELTDYGETLEEGMDVNRVETALKNVGVQLRDTNGQFRNLEDVLTELGGKWNTLNVNQQANVAVALAGTRQQSRLIAMMQDFDRTLELVDISTNSYGATMAQQTEYMGSLEVSMNQLTTAYEGLITTLADSEIIIQIVNGLSNIVEFISEALSYNFVLIPVLVLMGNYVLGILSNKIRQHQYEKANLKLQQQQQKIAIKNRLAEINVRKAVLQQYKTNLENNKALEDGLEIILEKAAIKAHEAGDFDLELKYRQQINELNKDDVQENTTLMAVQAELNALETEETNLLWEQNHLTQSHIGLVNGLQGSLFGTIGLFATIVSSIVQAVISTKALIAAKKVEEKQTKKNTIAILAEATGRKIAAAFGLAGSAAWIPYVGWGIGLSILAAILGTAYAIKKATSNNDDDKAQSTIEGNIKAMQKLQAEMYNLGQQRKTIAGIADEFDSLSSKITQSADDISRLSELITEFNDSIGFNLIAPGTDYGTAITMMRGYEAALADKMQALLYKSNETLAHAVQTSGDLIAYMQGEGARVISQLVSQNYAAFGNASATTQEIILDVLRKGNFVVSGVGIDFAEIQNTIKEEDIEKLDAALRSGSLTEYQSVLKSISDTARVYVTESNSVFANIANIDTEVLKQIDTLKLNADQLERFGPILAKIWSTDDTKIDLLQLYTKRMDAFANYKTQSNINDAITEAQGKKATILSNSRYKKLSKMDAEDMDEDEQAEYAAFIAELGRYENIVNEAQQAQKFLNMGVTEFFNTVGNISSLTDLQNEITQVISHMTMLGKLMRGELFGEELDELLTKYPELTKYLEDGVLSAEEYAAATAEMENNLQSTVDANVEKTRSKLQGELEANDINLDLNTLTYQSLVEAIKNLDSTRQDIILNAWYEYSSNKMKAENALLSDEAWKRIGESTGASLAKAQLDSYKKNLDMYSKNDAGYVDAWTQYFNALGRSLTTAHADKASAKSSIDAILKDKGFDENSYTIIEGEIFGIENGIIKALSEIENVELRNALGSIDAALIEAYANADETIIANAQEAAEAYIEVKNEQLEKEIEIIEKKKEAYEEYFDQIDALEEEQERAQSKEDIIRQLSALSTGIDGTTKSKIKDLQGKLNDLLKEEQQAAREAARDTLLEDLDDQTEQLNKSMETLDDSIGVLTRVLISNSGIDLSEFTYNSSSGESLTAQLSAFLHEMGIPGFSQGGLVDYTGLAMVHGSTNRPEAFLNAEDVDLISGLVEILHLVFDDVSGDNITTTNNNNPITIGSINIKTEHLNNTQDFKTAGSTLAEEFAAVIRERGLNVNVRK